MRLIEHWAIGVGQSISAYAMEEKHYENMPIQIYWKFYHQKMKIFR